MYDIHSHILPGIDDGAKSLEDSIELCRMASLDGTRAIVATPHIREGVWENDRGRISTRVEELREELKKRDIPIEIHIGAEVFFACEIFDAIREGAFPTYADGRKYFLLELPTFFIARQVQGLIFEFRTAGITPVLAHPERNSQIMGNLEVLEDLVRMGTLLQVTAMSLSGRFGRGARKSAEILMDRGLVHVVASDAHHKSFRPATLGEARKRVAERYGEDKAHELFVDTPRRIIMGEDVEGGVSPVLPPARGFKGLLARVFS